MVSMRGLSRAQFRTRGAWEALAIYLGIPLGYLAMGRLGLHLIIPTLVLMAIYAVRTTPRAYRRWRSGELRRDLLHILLRFGYGATIIAVGVYLYRPQAFLAFPRQQFGFWLALMILYPLLSVIPQELIYRAMFFHRLHRLSPALAVGWLIVLNGLIFSFSHLLFRNQYAVLLTIPGGMLFAGTFRRTRSLLCCCVEHALWGDFLFTIGLGAYFAGSAVAQNMH